MKGEHTGGLSHREIGERLGMSHAMVIIIEKRAIAKLRRVLQGVAADELLECAPPSNGGGSP